MRAIRTAKHIAQARTVFVRTPTTTLAKAHTGFTRPISSISSFKSVGVDFNTRKQGGGVGLGAFAANDLGCKQLSVRAYSTDSDGSTEALEALLTTSNLRALVESINKSDSPSLSFEDFTDLVQAHDIPRAEAKEVATKLHDVGQIMYLPDADSERLASRVFLKPRQLEDSLVMNFGIGDSAFTERKKAELEELENELKLIQDDVDSALAAARRRTSLWVWGGMGGLLAQWVVLAKWTWWDYSWDVIEPLTFFLTQVVVLGGYFFFAVVRKEYTFEEAADIIHRKRMRKELGKKGIDADRYEELQRMVDQSRRILGK